MGLEPGMDNNIEFPHNARFSNLSENSGAGEYSSSLRYFSLAQLSTEVLLEYQLFRPNPTAFLRQELSATT